MTSPAIPNQQDELLLVERVFLRIGSAATDDVLEEELMKFLAPVILKLASPHEAVRKKVMELLIHVNRRVKDHERIQLPVEALLKQYQDPNATSFVTNFSIIYIKMGYPRLDLNKQIELLPSMLNSLQGKPTQHQDSLLYLMIPVFGHMKIPDSAEKRETLFDLRQRTMIAKLLLDFMLDVLLLPYGATPLSQQGSADLAEDDPRAPPVPGVPAGMNITGFKRVMGDTPPKPEDLEKLKVSIIKFLSADVLLPPFIALHLIVGAADTRFSVANAADLHLRRIESTMDWNNSMVYAAIYVLFLGTLMPKDKTPADKFKNPANTRIRLKLMPYLLKSKEACNYAPLAVKVFYECLWGMNTNAKLRQQGVSFLHHVAHNADKEKLAPVGSVLFSGVVKVIEEEKHDAKLRSLAYGALAKLSVKLPNLLLSHPSQLHYLQTLMNALTQEEGDVLLAVQEALSMVAPVCKELDVTSQDQLCILLSDHVLHHNAQLRRTAVHYAASVFPTNHVPSRFILMVATGDYHDDIRLEARRRLYKASEEAKDGTKIYEAPPFSAVIRYVLERVDSMPRSKWQEIANQPIPFALPVMEQMLKYLEHCLAVEAGNLTLSEEGLFWSNPPAIGKLVRKILEQHHQAVASGTKEKGPNPFMRYVGFAELAANAWSAHALESILRIVAVAPEIFIKHYSLKMDWIRKFILRGGHYGEVAAHLFGVVAGQIQSQEEFEKIIYPVVNMKTLRVDSQESCVLAVGHCYSFYLYKMKKNDVVVEDWPSFENVIKDLVAQLLSDNCPLQNSIVTTLGEIARQTALPLPSDPGDSQKVTSLKLVEALVKIFGNKKIPSKVREQAISTAGYLCVGQEDFSHKQKVLESLLALAKETNEIEVHFAVGESLADCSLGAESPSGRNFWTDVDPTKDEKDEEEMMEQGEKEEREKDADEAMEKDIKGKSKNSGDVEEAMDICEDNIGQQSSTTEERDILTWLLDELLYKYVNQTKPSVRQASCIWLLALLKRCREKPIIQKRLLKIQSAFMSLLGDNNDLVQDAASKGLGVVYECCSEATRQMMVEGLVQTLTEGKSNIQNVTQETKIFTEGELGEAPSGGQLNTYRELCSLATDLNQPDLIYKFMNLANHNSVWNSRKGAAFGFSTLASQAGMQLEPYLPQIVPKLYRYQYDPTPKIQQPMTAIWNALVTDTAKTIEKYYDTILCDLINNLTNSAWRVRESSCLALTDLLRRQSATNALAHISEIWTTMFRVRDDIKESVRLAAEKTLQALSKSCIKVCEGTGTESKKMLQEVLPTLLTSGITSTVAEVRSISLQTVSKLCRSGGSLVKPHLGTLIPALLEALSGLESQALSYTSVRLNEDDREKLDMARVAAARSTPMMDTLNYVLQFVDESSMESLVGGLIDVLKSSVGLASRAGAAHVVETLTHTCPGPLEKYTGKLLAALVNGLNDRNVVVRKIYANAIGNLVKTAKPSSVEKLLTKLQTWYLEKEEDSVRLSAAITMRSMHAQNNDVMKQHACRALPLAFLAMHAEKTLESDPSGAEIWEEIWSDNTPGTESGVRLYLNEIIAICELALQSSTWAMKAQAGQSLSTLSKKLGSSMNDSLVSSLVILLTTSLHGRTWTGKESLVLALSNVSVHTKSHLNNLKHPDTGDLLIDEVVKVLTREASKEKKEYKIHAIKALTVVLDTYQIDRFEQVFEICLPYLRNDKDEQKEEAQEEERNKKEESLLWDLIDEMVHSLGRAWPNAKETQEKYSERVVEMLNNSASRVPRKTQLSIVEALKHFWSRHFLLLELPGSLENALFDPLLHHTCRIFNYCLGVAKFYSLRRESLVVLNDFLEKVKVSETLVVRMRVELLSGVEEARRDAQPDVQALAASAHKLILME